MFERKVESYLTRVKDKYKAITIVGPRQSGKTTLAKKYFENFFYVSLENPRNRARAIEDPEGFLSSLQGNSIIDEIQYAPDLLSYLQEILDNHADPRKFILTGSNSLKLSDHISQSLAGRTRIINLLPLSYDEIPAAFNSDNIWNHILRGSYPRLYNEDLDSDEWYADYYNTYVEKDVRHLLSIGNINSFDRFIRMTAGRVGQLVNHSSLSTDTGITSPTAAKWLSVLNASYITYTLTPHYKNFSKRITKAPKVYFYDTGLLCYLLRITSIEQLELHPLRGNIFENWIITEIHKRYFNQGKEAPLYFWRDQHGHEVDLIIDKGNKLSLFEIKSSATFKSEYLKNLRWLSKFQGPEEGTLVYSGKESYPYKNFQVISWKDIGSI